MSQQSKKLVLSKETLRQLDDQDLSAVVGGTVAPVNTLLCNGAGGLTSALPDTLVCLIVGNTAVCLT